MKALRNSQGLGMIETIVALMLLSLAITGYFMALSTNSKAVLQADKQLTIVALAQAQMEDTLAQPYLSAPATYPSLLAPDGYSLLAQALPWEGGDTNIQKVTVTVYQGEVPVYTVERLKRR